MFSAERVRKRTSPAPILKPEKVEAAQKQMITGGKAKGKSPSRNSFVGKIL